MFCRGLDSFNKIQVFDKQTVFMLSKSPIFIIFILFLIYHLLLLLLLLLLLFSLFFNVLILLSMINQKKIVKANLVHQDHPTVHYFYLNPTFDPKEMAQVITFITSPF